MARPVAIFKGVDTGGGCPCVTPPTVLGPPVGTVFANKIAVMALGDVLTPAAGKTCSSDPSPCTSPRIVKTIGKTFVDGAIIAKFGDILNVTTSITIPSKAIGVFAF